RSKVRRAKGLRISRDADRRSRRTMLKQRLLTAAIGLPILIIALQSNFIWILVPMFLVFVGLSTYEAAAMLLPTLAMRFSGEQFEKQVARRHAAVCLLIAWFLFAASSAGSVEAARGMIVAG